MLNPVLTEMAARERIAQMRRAGAKRAPGSRAYLDTGGTDASAVGPSARPARRGNPQQAVGWFLVSVGLHLALPRSRPGSTR
jgi:hypothetical protein